MSDLYDESDPGNPVVSAKGYALLLGVPLDQFRAEVDRQAAEQPSKPFQPPALWVANGKLRHKRYEKATGRADMLGALDYWQQRDGA